MTTERKTNRIAIPGMYSENSLSAVSDHQEEQFRSTHNKEKIGSMPVRSEFNNGR
jgi:hypothetical protein